MEGDVIRLNMLLTHYRQPLNWTEKGLKESKKTLDKWYKIIETNNQNLQQDHENISKKMMGALADDVNTPLAISELHQLYKAANDGDNKALNAFYSSCNLHVKA